MPLVLPDSLPALETLRAENVFVMQESQAIHQDIRPLKIAILNLMPLKIATEMQILRHLSNSSLQVEVELLRSSTYASKSTPFAHLERFYRTFKDVNKSKYDGLIVTGAPVEQLDFEEVVYWDELKQIIEWSDHNVTSTLYICWAVQAGLYHYYQIPKYPLEHKVFGVFPHVVNNRREPIVRGFDDVFFAPHARHTDVHKEDILAVPSLSIVSESTEAGPYIIVGENGRQVYVTGHAEYDPLTLKEEYVRDKKKGQAIDMPKNYFPADDPENPPVVRWRSHATLLFSNWLNYYVYQTTPYDLDAIG